MTQRRWGLVLARASIVGFARFPLLLLPVDQDRAVWLLVVAALPTAVSGFVGTAWLPKVTGHRHVFGPMPARPAPGCATPLVNWASTLTYQAPTFAMPVIVLVNVSADDNASFYVAWGVAAVACYVPDRDRAGPARRGRARRRAPAYPGAPGHRRGRRPDGGRRGHRHARAAT